VNGAVARGLETLLGQLAPGGRLVCIERQIGQIGLAGKATRYDNVGGGFGTRALFDAAGSLLTPFAPRPAFAF
jgi:protein-L-isoaspartate O-methyltransferase